MKVDEKYPVHKHTETLTQGHTNVSILNPDAQQPPKNVFKSEENILQHSNLVPEFY